MTARPQKDPASSGAAFLPVLTLEAPDVNQVELVTMRPAGVSPAFGPSVWRQRFGEAADARAVFNWMIERPERCLVWGRLAPIIGEHLLGDCIAEEMLADFKRRHEEREAHAAEKVRATRITVQFIEQGGRHGLKMQRSCDDEPFWSILLGAKWERDRLWDWMSWQTAKFDNWRIHATANGANSLARLVLDEMLRTEAAVKKAGLGAGGRRPLRFWRGDA